MIKAYLQLARSDYRFSSMWGVLGIVIGVFAFWFNFTMVPVMMPGYEVVAAPAIFLLSFFSEETDFTPKMVVFIFGQFMGYFCLAFLVRKIKKQR